MGLYKPKLSLYFGIGGAIVGTIACFALIDYFPYNLAVQLACVAVGYVAQYITGNKK